MQAAEAFENSKANVFAYTHVLLASMVCLPSIRWASVSPNTMSGTAVATFVKRGRFVMHSEYHASSRRAIMARSSVKLLIHPATLLGQLLHAVRHSPHCV
jgi:hypothetical protein